MEKLLRSVLKTVLLLAVLSSGFGSVQPVHAAETYRLPGRPVQYQIQTPALSCNQPVRIMPLGDSITRGSASGTPNDPQYYISYRRDLYQGLSDKGYWVDFVGSQRSDGSYYTDFDRDHEGWPAKRDEYIAQNIYTWLTNHPADIILLHIGTNDMSAASPDTRAADVEQILKEIDRFDPQIWVLVARIIQRVPYDQNTDTYNKNVNSMLDARIKDGDKILKVDMENGAGIIYADYPAGDMSDDKHPYATGYAKMAAKWEQALKTMLPSCGCDRSNPVVCGKIAFLPVVDNKASP